MKSEEKQKYSQITYRQMRIHLGANPISWHDISLHTFNGIFQWVHFSACASQFDGAKRQLGVEIKGFERRHQWVSIDFSGFWLSSCGEFVPKFPGF